MRKIRLVCRECQYMILALHNNQHQKSLWFLKVPCSSVASVATVGLLPDSVPRLATKLSELF